MADRQQSFADICVATLAEVNAMDADMEKDDPLRYQVWKLKSVSEKAVSDGMAIARQISDTVKVMKADQKARK